MNPVVNGGSNPINTECLKKQDSIRKWSLRKIELHTERHQQLRCCLSLDKR